MTAPFLGLIFLFSPNQMMAAEPSQLALARPGETIVLEPYGPNIIRVSISKDASEAVVKPGYGILPGASAAGWTQGQTDAADTYTSSRLHVQVFGSGRRSAAKQAGPPPLQTQLDIARFFNGSAPGAHIRISTPDEKTLVEMTGWEMAVPNHKDGNANVLYDRRPADKPFFQVGAIFIAPPDEHYYG
ncbi:MAG: alpha-glucosidase, partial [Acidobacteriaceae bacterium]|nr:alpha-glucosidase [Acidobacteriaceae bacterium]